ncbi:MAG: DUF1573 domain-containing protein [Bacteroidetes bacterium]|nr:DUF1573 domain-containing protein [Bacteroidota bacterium]
MKRILLLSIVCIAFFQLATAQGGAEITFLEERFDFGSIEEGPKVSHEFTFKNTGTEPLVLSNVKASCGCTTPSWPKDPILPGEQAAILVTYNTVKRIGAFNKSISISSNAKEATKIIYINGTVVAAPDEETMPIKQPLMIAPSN